MIHAMQLPTTIKNGTAFVNTNAVKTSTGCQTIPVREAFLPLWWLLKVSSIFRLTWCNGATAVVDGIILRLPMVVRSLGTSLAPPIFYLVSLSRSLVISSFSDSVHRC